MRVNIFWFPNHLKYHHNLAGQRRSWLQLVLQNCRFVEGSALGQDLKAVTDAQTRQAQALHGLQLDQ